MDRTPMLWTIPLNHDLGHEVTRQRMWLVPCAAWPSRFDDIVLWAV